MLAVTVISVTNCHFSKISKYIDFVTHPTGLIVQVMNGNSSVLHLNSRILDLTW